MSLTRIGCLLFGFAIVASTLMVASPASAQDVEDFRDWGFAPGAEVQMVGAGEGREIVEASISADGEWVVAVLASTTAFGQDIVRAKNTRTGQLREVAVLSTVVSFLTADQISHNGRYVAVSTGDGTFVIDLVNGTRVALADSTPQFAVLLSPDASVALTDGGVFSGRNGARVADLPPGEGIVGFDANGRLVVTPDSPECCAEDSVLEVHLVDPVTGTKVAEYSGMVELCDAGVAFCNHSFRWALWGFADALTADYMAWEFLHLKNFVSDELVFPLVASDTTVELIDVDRGTTVADAEGFFWLYTAYDYGPQEAAVMRLYQAFFDRDPDLEGAKYWLDILHDGNSLNDIATWMSDGQEFANNYNGTTNQEYVAAVYANVLGRDYDQEGYNYWLGLLDSGQLTRAGVVHWVSANTEFINNYPYRIN